MAITATRSPPTAGLLLPAGQADEDHGSGPRQQHAPPADVEHDAVAADLGHDRGAAARLR